MKRRFAQSSGSDSLELLLDTLCNVFGGIVLIACLMAIVPRATMPPPLVPVELATAQMTERRISSAQIELQRLSLKINEMQKDVDPAMASIQSRRDSFKRTLENLQADLKKTADGEMHEAEARAIVTQVDPADLNKKLDQLKLNVVAAENLSKASKEKSEFLEKRLKQLEEESKTLEKSKVQAVRFPRERIKNTSPFPLILKYGQLYPLVIGDSLSNNPAIQRIPAADGDGFRADPIRGKGISLPEARDSLAATLKAAAAEKLFVSVYLYPDSYEEFQELKNAMSEAKISYGIEFLETDYRLTFSSSGSAPPEL